MQEGGRKVQEGGRKVQEGGRKGSGYGGREQGWKESRKREKVWLSSSYANFLSMKQLGLLLLPQDGMLVH